VPLTRLSIDASEGGTPTWETQFLTA
jgi:hypothetical protein